MEFSINTLRNLNRHLQVTKMKTAMIAGILAIASFALAGPAFGICPYDLNCINNPYGAGNPYKVDGLMNPYSLYGSPYSNRSWTTPLQPNHRRYMTAKETIEADSVRTLFTPIQFQILSDVMEIHILMKPDASLWGRNSIQYGRVLHCSYTVTVEFGKFSWL